ncbi:MAG: hypothetical protein ACJ8HI_13830 [Massilia sp.]
MGPNTLFDKSFLQSLSVDESVWFDHFFSPVICPIFYVETLADLKKTPRAGSSRTPEDDVRILAEKTPVLSGAPCAHHMQLCIGNLLGQEAPHLGQVPIAGGRPVRSKDGKPGVVFQPSPEANAFSRWQRGQFLEIEHGVASSWRSMLATLNLREVGQRMRALGITPQTCRGVEEAYGVAACLVHSQAAPEEQLALLFEFVHIPVQLRGEIHGLWASAGFPPLAKYAPYAAHVLTVELFFQIALAAGHISAERASNRADIAYLFYLPFSHVFVSGDKLHRRCAAPFLKKGQEFVWAPDLKAGLSEIDQILSIVPEQEREVGLHKLAPRPPAGADNVASKLWERYSPGVREEERTVLDMDAAGERKLVDHVDEFAKAATAPEVAGIPSDELHSLTIERLVPPKRGKWWLIPKSVADDPRNRSG